MTVLTTEVRPGAYADSVVLMQLQSDLQRLDGVVDAGVVMATEVNLELLRSSRLLDRETESASPNDLVIAVRAESAEQATAALAKVETLLRSKKTTQIETAAQTKSATGMPRILPTAKYCIRGVAAV